LSDLNPFEPAEQDARRLIGRAWNRIKDLRRTYTTAMAIKMFGLAVAAGIVAVLNLPVFAVVLVVAVLIAQSVYGIYATKLLKDQDRELRWAWIAGKRVQQREMEARISVDSATVALLGERQIGGRWKTASPDLRAALAFHQRRLRLAEERADAAEAVNEGTATDAQRRRVASVRRDRQPEPPKPPASEPTKARRAVSEAERAALEAEIKSLATAEDVAAAMRAEEVEGARRTKRERQDAARQADQAARARVRAGRSPTAPKPERVINLELAANGERNVGTGEGRPTPEQIADGEEAAA
jgi:hypothetical protein